jgi:hypothetical protein
VNDQSSANLKAVRTNTLGRSPASIPTTLQELRDRAGVRAAAPAGQPDNPKNLYAIANLYEKFRKIDQAEETYKKVAEQTDRHYRRCWPTRRRRRR